jgi:hypothetical protein
MARAKLVDAIAASLVADQALEDLAIREKAQGVDYETPEWKAANRALAATYRQVPWWARWWSEKLIDAAWRARGSRYVGEAR